MAGLRRPACEVAKVLVDMTTPAREMVCRGILHLAENVGLHRDFGSRHAAG
jgi:hypothetical protein